MHFSIITAQQDGGRGKFSGSACHALLDMFLVMAERFSVGFFFNDGWAPVFLHSLLSILVQKGTNRDRGLHFFYISSAISYFSKDSHPLVCDCFGEKFTLFYRTDHLTLSLFFLFK